MGLKVGQRVKLNIEDVAFGGEGVARHDGMVVFVPFVDVGEVVTAEITELKAAFARARLVSVVESGPERIQPPCPYFGRCGGCSYQHLRYERQLEVKRKQVCDLLARIGRLAPDVVVQVIPSPKPYRYRSKIMVRSGWDKQLGRMCIGFLDVSGRVVVDIEECLLAVPEVNEQLRLLRQGQPPARSGLKYVLRVAPPGWEVPPDSFFQNNLFALPHLVETVRRLHREAGTAFLIDVYCGVGLFGIELAGQVTKFVGIEIDKRAVAAAVKNANARNVTNGVFVSGPAEALLAEFVVQFEPQATTVILDPPRVGCLPGTIQAIRAAGPAQVIYVSCNPATLARDLHLLCDGGLYEIRQVQPLDMFPQTRHVECIADVRRVWAG